MTCEELHEVVRRGVRYAYDSVRRQWTATDGNGSALGDDCIAKLPKNGVYIAFEKGELCADGKERIVRIGINEQPNRLPKRLKSHYIGTARKSVFRKHIGTALTNKLGVPATEEQISAYICANISFAVIEVEEKDTREQLEKMLIGTVARSKTDIASDGWLGKYCAAPKIKRGKLWNVNFLDAQPLTREYAQYIYDGLVVQ